MLSRTIQLYKNSFEGLTREVWLLALVMLINRSGTMVIPFLSLYLTSDLEFSLPQAGWVMSAFGLGSVAGSYLGGTLTDKIGFMKVMFWSLFLGGMSFLLFLVVHEFYWVCGIVFVVSTIGESFRPANFTAIAYFSTEETRSRAIGLIRMAINLGFAIGPAMGGFIAYSIGFDYLFIIDFVTCVSAALLFRYFFKNVKIDLYSTPTDEKILDTAIEEPVQSPYKDIRYLFFMVLVFLNAFVFFQIFSTEPVFFRDEFFLTEKEIGSLMAINGLIIAVLEMPMIYALEKKMDKYYIVVIGVFLTGLSYFLFNFLPVGYSTALITVIVITFGEIMSLPFLSTMAINRANDKNRGKYMAVFTMTYSLAHIVAPNLGAQIADNIDWATLWTTTFVISVVAVVGFLILKQTRPAEAQVAVE